MAKTETGTFNPACGIAATGLKDLGSVRYNLTAPDLYELALSRGEAKLTDKGALVAYTGQHTGRSPKDKFVVRDASTEAKVWWDNNKAITPAQFDALFADFVAHAKGKDLFVQDLEGGADPANVLPVRVVTEFAWHSLFIRNLLIRPDRAKLASFGSLIPYISSTSFGSPDRSISSGALVCKR